MEEVLLAASSVRVGSFSENVNGIECLFNDDVLVSFPGFLGKDSSRRPFIFSP